MSEKREGKEYWLINLAVVIFAIDDDDVFVVIPCSSFHLRVYSIFEMFVFSRELVQNFIKTLCE